MANLPEDMKILFLGSREDNHTVKWIEYFRDRVEICWVVQEDFNYNGVRKVRKAIKEFEPDIVHALYAGTWGLLGAFSGFSPLIVTAFGSDVFANSKVWWKRLIAKFILKKADTIFCNSWSLHNKILGLGGRNIGIVHWGQDSKKFKPIYAKEKFPTIISLRNLEPVYNVETLIRAVPLVLKEFPKAKFIIAGRGSEESMLKKMAEPYKENIHFIGWIEEKEIIKRLSSSTIYVSTSLSDGDISQCTQQAMLCEVPSVMTDIEVNRDLIQHCVNGLLFMPKDSESLCNSITMLLGDEELREDVGKAGRETIKAFRDFDTEMEMAEMRYEYVQTNSNRF